MMAGNELISLRLVSLYGFRYWRFMRPGAHQQYPHACSTFYVVARNRRHE
jgi:hypothetical protein